jgi:glycopeptide antibiotics resistance protein
MSLSERLTETEVRPPKSHVRELFAATGLAVCIGVVLFATMSPVPLDQGYSSSIERLLGVLHRNGVPTWFGYNRLEFSANVLMFIPVGFLLTLLLPRKAWWLSILICLALSGGIEYTQSLLLTERFATVLDVIANSSGAVIGVVIAVTIYSIVYARDQKLIARALWDRSARHH